VTGAAFAERLDARRRRLIALVQDADLERMPRWKAAPLGILRGILAIVREASEGQLTLRAMSLVYTTLLSMVPLLAFSFSVLKAFGAHNAVEPFLLGVLEPLGEQGVEIAHNVIEFVDNVRVGVLGFVGLLFLLYTVIALVQKIELAFNSIWRVEHSRSLAQRFSNYLSVILIGPLLVVSAMGITATVMSTAAMQTIAGVEPFGTLITEVSRLVPYLLIIAAFTFIYVFVPNTRVRLLPALAGAVVAGVLWQSVGWGFANLVAGSARYAAIYSSFAILILLLIWLYLAWLILLIGANVAFYVQYPDYMNVRGVRLRLSGAARERMGLHLMQQVAQRFVEGRPAATLSEIAHELHVPGNAFGEVARVLEDAGLLVRAGAEDPRFLPGRDLEAIHLEEILQVLRRDADAHALRRLHGDPVVDDTLAELESARHERLEGRTLRDLLVAPADDPADTRPAPEGGRAT